MKICYFTPYYPPQSEAAATRSYWFIKTLSEAGHEVKIITNSRMYLKLATNKERAIKRLFKENLVGIELFFRLLLSKSQLVVLSSPPYFTVMWGIFACWIIKRKYILDIRDLYPEVFFEMGLIPEESFLIKVAKRTTKCAYQRALGIMTVTQGLANEIKAYGINNTKIVLARNGFDPELFYPGEAEDKFERFTLIFQGTLGKAQNIETLLHLAKELETDPEIEIVVAGSGPKLQEILKAKRPNIRYLGNLSYQEIPSLLRKCHVGLSFRTDDKIGNKAFPVKVFEYIGSGLPVILSPKGEAGRIIEREKLGKEFGNLEVKDIKEHIQIIKRKYPQIKNHSLFSRKVASKKILDLLNCNHS